MFLHLNGLTPALHLFSISFLPLPTPEMPSAYYGKLLGQDFWEKITKKHTYTLPALEQELTVRLYPGSQALMFSLEAEGDPGVKYAPGAEPPRAPLMLALVGCSAAPQRWAQLRASVVQFRKMYEQLMPRELHGWEELPEAPPTGDWLAVVAMPGLSLYELQVGAIIEIVREISQELLPVVALANTPDFWLHLPGMPVSLN